MNSALRLCTCKPNANKRRKAPSLLILLGGLEAVNASRLQRRVFLSERQVWPSTTNSLVSLFSLSSKTSSPTVSFNARLLSENLVFFMLDVGKNLAVPPQELVSGPSALFQVAGPSKGSNEFFMMLVDDNKQRESVRMRRGLSRASWKLGGHALSKLLSVCVMTILSPLPKERI